MRALGGEPGSELGEPGPDSAAVKLHEFEVPRLTIPLGSPPVALAWLVVPTAPTIPPPRSAALAGASPRPGSGFSSMSPARGRTSRT